jgi:hypothetical protein
VMSGSSSTTKILRSVIIRLRSYRDLAGDLI